MKIPYINLQSQWEEEKNELWPIIETILSSGNFVGGKEIEKFENKITNYCNIKFCVALNSGTDALTLALHCSGVGKGDEVITVPNSFIASTAAIIHLGAKPVFVDVLNNQNIDPAKIEEAINSKTKAIMPVHLTGRICEMNSIIEIANKYNIFIIEDAAQAIGSKYKNKFSGTFGKIGCFSTHPLKNLNACGDGGFLTTNDKKIYLRVKSLRTHGMIDRNVINEFGYVSRMDNLQAAILNYRIEKLDEVIKKRRSIAKKYINNLDKNKVFIPAEREVEFNTYHTFVIQVKNRDKLKRYLKQNNVETAIHYPIPIHLQPAANFLKYSKGDFPQAEKMCGEILTLPINQFLKNNEIEKIINLINNFYK